jgi:thiol-disulfide isomerase/thioredoxin
MAPCPYIACPLACLVLILLAILLLLFCTTAVLAANTDKLVVLMASVTWCKPCKGFQETYEQAARHYTDAVFLKFYGEARRVLRWK